MKSIITITCLMGVIQSWAQPQIQSSYMQTGFTYNLYKVENPDINNIKQAGANVAWNISSTTTILAGKASLVPASSTPYATTYPDANFAIRFEIGSQVTYSLFKLNTGNFEQLGDQLGSSSSTHYDVTRDVIKFPFAFNESYTDNYQKSGQSVKTAFYKYDAYGTLQTADTTWSNVMRVLHVNGDGDTSALWWSVNNGRMNPLLQADEDGLIMWKEVLNSGVKEEQLINSSVFPNPVDESFVVTTEQPVNNGRISIYDISGRQVHEEKWNGNTTIHTGEWKSGIYFYELRDEQDRVSRGKIMKR